MNNNEMIGRGNLTAVAASDETKKIAEVQAKMVLARKFPRDLATVEQYIMRECENVDLAEKAVYEFPRGTSVVTGPSIRLMECVARYYGNLLCGVEELSRSGKTATVRAYAWDLETNFADEKVFDVELKRDTKSGGYYVTDERDKYEILANQAARRKRACLQAIIPKYVVDAAVEACQKTLEGSINPDDIEKTKDKMLAAFKALDGRVTEEMLGSVCGKDYGKIGSRDIVKLRNLYNAIKDGMVKADAAFGFETAPTSDEKSKADALSEKLAGLGKKEGKTDETDAG